MLEQRQRNIKVAEHKEASILNTVMEIRPATPELYRSRVAELVKALSATEAQAATAAAETLRKLIHQIVLTPDDTAPNRHRIEVHGNFAAALAMAHSGGGGSTKGHYEPMSLSSHIVSTRLSLIA